MHVAHANCIPPAFDQHTLQAGRCGPVGGVEGRRREDLGGGGQLGGGGGWGKEGRNWGREGNGGAVRHSACSCYHPTLSLPTVGA